MKVIRNSVIPFGKRYGAINLFGVLFAKRDMHLSGEVMNHELIHSPDTRVAVYPVLSDLYYRVAYKACAIAR